MTGKYRTVVLNAYTSLDKRKTQVAENRNHGVNNTEYDKSNKVKLIFGSNYKRKEQAEYNGSQYAENYSADCALNRFLGLTFGQSLCLPKLAPIKIRLHPPSKEVKNSGKVKTQRLAIKAKSRKRTHSECDKKCAKHRIRKVKIIDLLVIVYQHSKPHYHKNGNNRIYQARI